MSVPPRLMGRQKRDTTTPRNKYDAAASAPDITFAPRRDDAHNDLWAQFALARGATSAGVRPTAAVTLRTSDGRVLSCDHDQGAALMVDTEKGTSSCRRCGAVVECNQLDQQVTADSKLRKSAEYERVYHANEVFAAYLGQGPPVPAAVLLAMQEYVEHTYIVAFSASAYDAACGPVDDRGLAVDAKGNLVPAFRLNPMRMRRPHYRQMCTALGVKSFAERWVAIKTYLTGGRFRPIYPSKKQLDDIQVG
jgi:hypothetical protein